MPKSTLIESEKRRRFEIIDNTMTSLCYYRDQVALEEAYYGKVNLVKYMRDDSVIYIDFYPSKNSDVVKFDRKASFRELLRVTNAILANAFYMEEIKWEQINL